MEGTIPCQKNILQFHVTFNCGQCYRWNWQSNGSWVGVFRHCVWVISHENNVLFYKVSGDLQRLINQVNKAGQTFNDYCNVFKIRDKKTLGNEDFVRYTIWDYFRFFENLEEHYKRWSLCDSNFEEKANQFYGLRMLKQDIEEVLFTYICSSNTTINRIKTMVENICSLYGDKICEINGVRYHDFPDVSKLAKPSVIDNLKKAKFGFRAKYVVTSACKILKMGGEEWFKSLRAMNYHEAKAELMLLPGIGEKVADCICLMGLDHLNAIPVDTHVFQISKQYIPMLRDKKTVNKTIYHQIGDFFRTLFGLHAGWAHVVLFCADLKMHQSVKTISKVAKKPKHRISKVVTSKYFNKKSAH